MVKSKKCDMCQKYIAKHKIQVLSCHKVKWSGETAMVCDNCKAGMDDMYWDAKMDADDIAHEQYIRSDEYIPEEGIEC